MREPSTVLGLAGVRISKPISYLESETDIFAIFDPRSLVFNREMFRWVILNIYHENNKIFRIIIVQYHFKPIS